MVLNHVDYSSVASMQGAYVRRTADNQLLLAALDNHVDDQAIEQVHLACKPQRLYMRRWLKMHSTIRNMRIVGRVIPSRYIIVTRRARIATRRLNISTSFMVGARNGIGRSIVADSRRHSNRHIRI
jgi:hypothetical protein